MKQIILEESADTMPLSYVACYKDIVVFSQPGSSRISGMVHYQNNMWHMSIGPCPTTLIRSNQDFQGLVREAMREGFVFYKL
jgi:hypothetical protein